MTKPKNTFLVDLNQGFTENGPWEQNDGKQQTRLFAACFDRAITFDDKSFSLLDVGCALGQAAAFFNDRYPQATVSATDVSDVAIQRCRELHDDRINFYIGGFGQITDFYDVIYCSNVLEHFHDFAVKTRELAASCKRLCIMVPYNERSRDGSKLIPDPLSIEHQITFHKDSFDYLIREGLAESVRSTILSCPGAWGWSRRQKITHAIDNLFRRITNRPVVQEYLQIVFDIRTQNNKNGN